MSEQPDRLELAFQALFDLVETYGGERIQQQQEMWGRIEDVMEELAEAGIAEGLRQATEGWEREWLVNHPPYGGADTFVTEGSAREEAARVGRPVFVRLVGPWEPAAEQPEPDRSAPARVHVRHDPAALMEEPDLYAAEKPEGSDR